MQNTVSEHKPWSRWATATEDHTRCQLRKTLPGLMCLDFSCNIQMVRIWPQQHDSMDPSCLVSTVQAAGGVMVFWVFSWHAHHSLSEYCCWPCPSLFDHSRPSSDDYFQQDNEPCHKAQTISDWFLEFLVLQWSPQSPDLSPTERLWDVVDQLGWYINLTSVYIWRTETLILKSWL